MRLVWGTVTVVLDSSGDIQRLSTRLDDDTEGVSLAYRSLCGECVVGDRVLVNTTAVDLSLGTGGAHTVVSRLGDSHGVALDSTSGGHIMKLRYAPHQIDVLCAEEQQSPHHEAMANAESLTGMPVACCGLHSQVPLVAAAVKQAAPDAVIAYVMTDQASLPYELSQVARAARDAGLLDATITCGQAFGAEYEAVNLYSALLVAHEVVHADVTIVGIGPGIVGTATRFGHGGVAQGEAINAVAALGGVPVAVLRASEADERPRHRGVSHHTLVALTRVAAREAHVPVPSRLADNISAELDAQLLTAGVWTLHSRVDIKRDSAPDMRGVKVSTMGRGQTEDPLFFACAYSAGDACVRVMQARRH